MTALAFIFAIQEHDPASFYILDEVDAALDKHNSEKLAKLVANYSGKAQYIMISHNDGVISEAENIYGISMDEHGMSRGLRPFARYRYGDAVLPKRQSPRLADPVNRPGRVVDEAHIDLSHAFDPTQLLADLLLDHGQRRATHEGGQDIDPHRGHVSVVLDTHRLHEAQIDDADGHLGVGHARQRLHDGLTTDHPVQKA